MADWKKVVLATGTGSQYIKGDGTFGTYSTGVGLGDANTWTALNTFSSNIKIENSSASAKIEFKRTSASTSNYILQAYSGVFELYDLADSREIWRAKDDGTFAIAQNTTVANNVTISGHTGIGKDPATDWKTNVVGLHIGAGGTLFARSDSGETKVFFAENTRWTNGGYVRINQGYSAMHYMDGGAHTFAVGGTGNANTTISFTNALILSNAGNATFGGDVTIGSNELIFDAGEKVFSTGGYVVADGDAGFIARDSGSNKLIINGDNATFAGNITLDRVDGFVYLSNAGTGNDGAYIRSYGGGHVRLNAPESKQHEWEIGGVQKFRIESTSATFAGDVTVSKSSDGGDSSLTINNSASHGSTDETASLKFQQAGYTGGKIVSNRAFNYSSAGNRDSTLQFYTSQDASDVLAMTIDASQNVGIGTAGSAPSKLTLTSALGDGIRLQRSGVESTHYMMFDPDSINAYPAGGAIYLNNDIGSDVYMVTGGGQVGIGTTSPTGLLNLYKSNASAVLTIQRREVDGALTTGDIIGQIDFVTNDDSYNSGNNTVRATIKADIQSSTSASGLIFETGNSNSATAEAMYISPNSNVGIGTHNPDTKLQIRGDFDASSGFPNTNPNKGLNISKYTGVQSDYGNNDKFGITFTSASNADTDYAIAGIYGQVSGVSSYVGGHIVFASRLETESALSEKMVITSSGNVSIGMPVAQMSKTFHVQSNTGSANTPNGIMLTNTVHGSDSQIYMYAESDSGSANSGVIKFDPDLKRMKLIGSGNVGLYIDHTGHTNFESNANLADDLALSLGSSTDAQLFVSSGDGHTYFRNNTSSADIIFKVKIGSTDTQILRLDGGAGNVELGGDTHLGSGKSIIFTPTLYSSNVQGLKFNDGGAVDSIIQPVRLGNNQGAVLYLGANSYVNTSGGTDRYSDSSASSGIEIRPENGQIRFLTNDSSADPLSRMAINSNGRVGIGTDSPARPLHIDTSAHTYVRIESADTAKNSAIEFFDGTNYFYSGFMANESGVSAGEFAIYTGSSSPAIVVEQDGDTRFPQKVAIGSATSPSYKLDITGPATENGSTLRLNDVVASKNSKHLLIQRSSSTASIGIAGSQANDPLWISRSGGYDLMVTSAGNIGIGVSAPSQKLHISSSSVGQAKFHSTGSSGARIYISDSSAESAIMSQNANLIFEPVSGTASAFISANKVFLGKNINGGTSTTELAGYGVLHSDGSRYGNYGWLTFNAPTNNYTSGARGWAITNGYLATEFAILKSSSASGEPYLTSGGIAGTGTTVPFRINASGNATFGGGVSMPSGNVSVGGKLNVASSVGIGSLGLEKTFSIAFADGVSHQKAQIQFTKFWGELEISVTGTFANQNMAGVITKKYGLGVQNYSTYANESRYTESLGVTANNFAIGEITWDTTNSRYYIPIVHRVSTGNTAQIRVRCLGGDGAQTDYIEGLTVSSVYTTDTTAYDKPEVSFVSPLGIDTATPQSSLHVHGSSGIRLTDSNQNANEYSEIKYDNAGTTNLYINNDWTNSNALINFQLAGSTKMVVRGDGHVGIGTQSPQERLHIKQGNNDDSIISPSGLVLEMADDTANDTIGITFENPNTIGNAGSGGAITAIMTENSNGATELAFSTRTGGGTSGERVRIDATGNVGIGTTNPSSPAGVGRYLHIANASHAGIVLDDTGSTAYDIYSADGHLYAYSEHASKNTLVVNNVGDTNIYGGTGLTQLTVNGAGGETAIRFKDSDGNVDGYVYANTYGVGFLDEGGHWTIKAQNNTGIYFYTNNGSSQHMQILNSGNVGIGTTNDTYKLEVAGSNEDLLKLHNKTDGLDSLISFTNPGGTLARIQGIDNGGLQFDTGNNAGGINTNAMFIANDAKVGIGTTQPDKLLHVSSSDDVLATFESTDTHATVRVIDPDTSNEATLTRVGDNLEIVKDGGNVSIGKDNPAQALDVNGSIISSGVLLAPTYATFIHNFYDNIGTTAHYLPWGNIDEHTGNDDSRVGYLAPMSMTLKKLFVRIESISNIGNHNLTVTLICKVDGTITNTTVATAIKTFSASNNNKTVTYLDSDFSATPRLSQKQLGSLKIQFGSDYGGGTDFFVTSVWRMNNNTL